MKSNQLDGATKFQNLSSKQLPSRKPVDISVKELKETNNTSSPGKLNISSGGAVGALFGAKGGGRGSGGSRQQNQGDDEAVRLQHHSKGNAGGSLENNNKDEGECESTHSKFSEKTMVLWVLFSEQRVGVEEGQESSVQNKLEAHWEPCLVRKGEGGEATEVSSHVKTQVSKSHHMYFRTYSVGHSVAT